MKAALLVMLAGCAAPQRPPPRLADEVQIQQVQVGWMQIASGQINKPPVNDLRHGNAPDQVQAEEIAQAALEKCRMGAPMERLQKDLSEEPPGTISVNVQTKKAFRDFALALKPGECGLYRSNYAFHVLKRVG